MAEKEDLERLAREEILKETKSASVRVDQVGPQGWMKCPIPKANKRFLRNTILQTTSSRRKQPCIKTVNDETRPVRRKWKSDESHFESKEVVSSTKKTRSERGEDDKKKTQRNDAK